MDQSKGTKANFRTVKQARKISYDKLSDARSQIRLLSIAPGDWTDPIQASLKTFERATVPWFAAISYTWGDPNKIESIFVNEKEVDVRYNCWYALAQARHHGKGSCLWIDALCINQDDDEEKSWQVAQMGEIFRGADAVYCCVGAHSDDSEWLFRQFDEVSAHCKAHHMDEIFSKAYPGRRIELKPALDKMIGRVGYSEDRCRQDQFNRAYIEFCNRPYWNRLWTLQEIVLGNNKQVWCDVCTLNLHILLEIDYWVHLQMARCGTQILLIGRFILECQNSGEHYDNKHSISKSALSVLETVCSKQCEDPRDLFYGSSSITRLPIVPDYSKSTCEVAFEAICALMSAKLQPMDEYHARLLHDRVKSILKYMGVTAEDWIFNRKIQERLISDQCIDISQSIICALPWTEDTQLRKELRTMIFKESNEGQLRLDRADEQRLLSKTSTPLIPSEIVLNEVIQVDGTGLVARRIIKEDGSWLGVTSIRSRPDDFLVYVGCFDEFDIARYLVLRPCEAASSKYRCIGQAIIFTGAAPESNFRFHKLEFRIQLDSEQLDVEQIDVENWLIFFVQSIVPRHRNILHWTLKCAATAFSGPGELSVATLENRF